MSKHSWMQAARGAMLLGATAVILGTALAPSPVQAQERRRDEDRRHEYRRDEHRFNGYYVRPTPYYTAPPVYYGSPGPSLQLTIPFFR